MHSWQKALVATAVFYTMAGSYAFADPPGDHGPSPGLGYANGWDKGGGPGDGGGSNRGAPGPIAGAGLPFLLLAGGYILVRRRFRNRARATTIQVK